MKRPLILLFFLGFTFSICNGQTEKHDISVCQHDDTLKQFFGTIGDIPVEIFLKKNDTLFEGYLDYLSNFWEFGYDNMPFIKLNGSYSKDGIIKLYGYGIFEGKCDQDKITGTWIDLRKDSLKYPFILRLTDYLYYDWLTYTNKDLGIQFKYPKTSTIKIIKGSKYCPEGRNYLGDCNALEIFQENKTIQKIFIDIRIPVDTTASLLERILFISSWKEDSCCRSVRVSKFDGWNRLDTFYSKKFGSNLYFVQTISEGAMSKSYYTCSYSTCNANDKRCFAFNYSTCIGSLGPYDVPYHDGYYNYDYDKGSNNKMNGNYDFWSPKPYNEKAEENMIEHIVSSLTFVNEK